MTTPDREAFEKWAKGEFPNWGGDLLHRRSDGEDLYMREYWIGWQAALSAPPQAPRISGWFRDREFHGYSWKPKGEGWTPVSAASPPPNTPSRP
jgi:hypothetical protein